MSSERALSAPLVTVGIPCYNSEKYLAQSIESLLGQTYSNFVMVICDNASTDGTADICKRYERQDSRVHYHRNPTNVGMTGNFNRVFSLTETKYLKWSTADDFWASDMLSDAVAILEADESIGLVYPRAVLVDADGKETQRYEDKLHLMQDDPAQRFRQYMDNVGLVNHHLGLLRTDTIRKTMLFGKHVGADIGFLAEMSLHGKFYENPKYQFFRRFHGDSSSWNRKDEAQAARRFYATNVRRLPFVSWRAHGTYMRAVLRSSLPIVSKLSLLGYLTKGMYWNRQDLGSEVVRDTPLAMSRWFKGKH